MNAVPEPPVETSRPSASIGASRLKGLSHPLRVRILDLLQVHGSLTASRLAELVDESSGSTSYHLRQLAKHDFVREVEDKGTARERWWEATPGGFTIGMEAGDDAGTRTTKSLVNAEFERARQQKVWQLLEVMGDDGATRFPAWQQSVVLSTANAFATPEQLAEITEEVQAVLSRQLQRLRNQQDTPGALPVQIHFNAFPVIDDGLGDAGQRPAATPSVSPGA